LVSAGRAGAAVFPGRRVVGTGRPRPGRGLSGAHRRPPRPAGGRAVVGRPHPPLGGCPAGAAPAPPGDSAARRLLPRGPRRPPPRPDVAILTDSPDFHLRVARRLHRQGVPVVYLVAPQAWAWRKGRVAEMRRTIRRLLCIFPFEEEFFAREGVAATYI